jgi:ABC-type Zn2+ transport system substrate-binding protein/surface adhesin
MFAVMQQLIESVAGSTGVSDHNRLLKAKRKRRVRIGLKAQDWLRSKGAETLEWYGKLDEELVVKQVQSLQMGANFEQFSDEEGGDEEERGDDEEEEEEQEEEDGSWQDSDDEEEHDDGDEEEHDILEAEPVD